MAVITPSSFDPLKTRCNVRLQQGVPVVDADWNEADDIRKFERRALARWFVGDGVPEGNDGFRIDAIGAADDVIVRAGGSTPAAGAGNTEIALRNVGRMVVDGLDVIIPTDMNFKAQPAPIGGAAIAPIPVVTGAVTVYLDVWERLVTLQEDSSLVVPSLGIESCARMKRVFCVRARTGTTAPVVGDSDFAAGHVYYALATIDRKLSAPNVAAPIVAADVTDRRERRLLTVPSTLVTDVLGVSSFDYRRGAGRPAMSLRDAINALLRGDLPGTPETVIAPDPNQDFMTYGLTFEPDSSATIVWHSNRVGGGLNNQVFASRWDASAPAAGFSTPATPITIGPVVHAAPHSLLLPTGELLAVYTAGAAGAETVVFKRGAGISGLAASAESPVAGAAGDPKRHPFAIITGTLGGGGFVVFFWHETLPAARWAFRRRQYTSSWAEADAKWLDAAGVQLPNFVASTPSNEAGSGVHAAADATGNIWFASVQPLPTNITVLRLTPSTGAFISVAQLTAGPLAPAGDSDPFILIDGSNAAWVFWVSAQGVMAQRFQPGGVLPDGGTIVLPGTGVIITEGIGRRSPSATIDSSGAIWVFFITDGGPAVTPFQVFAIRRDPLTQSWGQVRKITGSSGTDSHSRTFVATAPNGVLWGLFKRLSGTTNDLFFKQIVTAI